MLAVTLVSDDGTTSNCIEDALYSQHDIGVERRID